MAEEANTVEGKSGMRWFLYMAVCALGVIAFAAYGRAFGAEPVRDPAFQRLVQYLDGSGGSFQAGAYAVSDYADEKGRWVLITGAEVSVEVHWWGIHEHLGMCPVAFYVNRDNVFDQHGGIACTKILIPATLLSGGYLMRELSLLKHEVMQAVLRYVKEHPVKKADLHPVNPQLVGGDFS